MGLTGGIINTDEDLNASNFDNLVSSGYYPYWTSTHTPNYFYWVFGMFSGFQGNTGGSSLYSGIALRNGEVTFGSDKDGDGYFGDDCDDLNASTFPGAPEDCDMQDNDCDGLIPAGEVDNDLDGYMVCSGDCDDANASINPEAFELPGNVVDEDCDGSLGACNPNAEWRNHGKFVRCVAHETDALIEQGVLSEEEGDALINTAAQSDVGKK